MISEALKKITHNFEKGFNSTTLMAQCIDYDEQGRPLTADLNYRSGEATIKGKTYWFVRKGWKVRIWDKFASYTDFMSNKKDFIEEVDLTPDYVLKYLKTR